MICYSLIVLYLMVVGSRTHIGTIPQGATCSAIISAACHNPIPDDKDVSCFPLKWGEIEPEKVRFRLPAPTSNDSTDPDQQESSSSASADAVEENDCASVPEGHIP